VAYLRGLFADDNFNRGEPEGPPETSFRVLTPEVVLVSAHLRIKGQGLVGGGTLDRDNFSLRALQRQADGSWLIVSEMFQDANTETTYTQ
jgi:ketosteroid isomerase-like protein